MSTYALVTSGGLNKAAQASESGHFIKLKYYIPVYDYRIDENIDPDPQETYGWNVNEISSVEGYSATFPCGERLWKDDAGAYSLTDADQYWVVSAGTVGSTPNVVITNPEQNVSMPVNLRNGDSMWDWISADTADPPGATTSSWTMYNATKIANNNASNNPETTTDRSKYFSNITYGAFLDPATGRSRGSWQARINSNVGQFKFNKIALYAVAVDSNGVEVSASQAPTLFAMVIFPTQIKTNFKEGGVDDVVVDFQLDISPTAIDFNNLLYGTSGDYWAPVEVNDPTNEISGYGLHNSGDVFISHMFRSEDFCAAKTVISTQHTINHGGELSAREREMPQLAMQYIDNSTGTTVRKRVTVMCTSAGDLYIDGTEFGSGLIKIKSNGIEPSIDVDDAHMLLGGSNAILLQNYASSAGSYGYRIEEPNATSSTSAHGHFTGGDLIRRNQPQIIRVENDGENSSSANSDVYIVAGVNPTLSASTHAELLEKLRSFIGEDGQISTESENEFVDSTLNVVGPGGIKFMSRKDIEILPQDDGVVKIRGDVNPVDKGTFDLGSSAQTWREAHIEELHGDQDGIVELNASLVPDENDTRDIGAEDKLLKNIWAKKICGWHYGYAYSLHTTKSESTGVFKWVDGEEEYAKIILYTLAGDTLHVSVQIKGLKVTFANNNSASITFLSNLSVNIDYEATLYKWLGNKNFSVTIQLMNAPTIGDSYYIDQTFEMTVTKQYVDSHARYRTKYIPIIASTTDHWSTRIDDPIDGTYGWRVPLVTSGAMIQSEMIFSTKPFTTDISDGLKNWIAAGPYMEDYTLDIANYIGDLNNIAELKNIITIGATEASNPLVSAFETAWGSTPNYYSSMSDFLTAKNQYYDDSPNVSDDQVRFKFAYNSNLYSLASTGTPGAGWDDNIGTFKFSYVQSISAMKNSLVVDGDNIYLIPNIDDLVHSTWIETGTFRHKKHFASDDLAKAYQQPIKIWRISDNNKQHLFVGRIGYSYYKDRKINTKTIQLSNVYSKSKNYDNPTSLKDSSDKGWDVITGTWSNID